MSASTSRSDPLTAPMTVWNVKVVPSLLAERRATQNELDNLPDFGYYLSAMNRRVKFINVLVLGFYFSYAFLPLLYSTRSAQAEDWADDTYASLSTVQRSILEQSLLFVSSEEQGEHSSASSSHILLKKKRAIAPSFKQIIAKIIPQLAKFSDFEPSFKISLVPLQIPDDTPNCPNGFPYYHSGISPPSA